MTNRLWAIVAIVGVVALGAGVGIGAAAWAGGDHASETATADDSSHGGMTMDGATAGGEDGSELSEQAFLEQMVPHHESAIEMAAMAAEKGQSSEVRQLAQQIISTQEDEIAQMRAYHQEFFGEELVASTEGPHHAGMDMTELEAATGREFDRVFLRMMIPHHASAITMAESVMMGEPRQQIETLANEIIAAQSKEIGEMQEWREQFFPPLG